MAAYMRYPDTSRSFTCTPGGRKGSDPGARMMSFAVNVFPVSTALIVLGPASSPVASTTSTPRVLRDPCQVVHGNGNEQLFVEKKTGNYRS